MMISRMSIVAMLLVSACNQEPANQRTGTNQPSGIDPNATVASDCALPELLLAPSDPKLGDQVVAGTKAHFATAYGRACVAGKLESTELLDPTPGNEGKLFLFNAPEANIASIYLSDTNGKRMVLEYPFVTPDGQSHVPPVEDLEEAIHCKMIGATPEEEESTGRCLPD